MKTDEFNSGYGIAEVKNEEKCISRQLRWLRVSPYLLLSWLAAGMTLPLAVTLLVTTQYNASMISSNAKSAQLYSINDILQAQRLSQSRTDLLAFRASLNLSQLFEPNSQTSASRTYFSHSKKLSDVSISTLSTHCSVCSNPPVFSGSVFSSHPQIKSYSILTWLVKALSIRAGPQFFAL